MGADSKNQGGIMCCQHKIYDIILKRSITFLADIKRAVFKNVELL